MSEETGETTLRRKLGSGGASSDNAQRILTNAMRRAVLRGAQKRNGMVACVAEISERRISVVDIVAGLTEPATLLLLKGENNAYGLALADIQFTAAVVEFFTTGRIAPAPADARQPTQTDAAIVADFINIIMAEFDGNLSAEDANIPATGFRYDRRLAEPRAISLAIEDVPYRQMMMNVDFANGAKSGVLTLLLPWSRGSMEQLGRESTKSWRSALRTAVSRSQVSLDAVLFRLSLPLNEVSAWDVGTLVAVPLSSLNDVGLYGENGKKIARTKLGQCAGARAVRIQVWPSQKNTSGENVDFRGAVPAAPVLLADASDAVGKDVLLAHEDQGGGEQAEIQSAAARE